MSNDRKAVGVTYHPNTDTYTAYISYHTAFNKTKSKQKTFPTFEEALTQRKQWEKGRDAYYRMIGRWDLVKPNADPTKLCTDNCADCIYSEKMECKSDELCCLYILMTNHKRPCKPGDGCTVKVQRAPNHNQLKQMNYMDSFVIGNHRRRKKRVANDLKILT